MTKIWVRAALVALVSGGLTAYLVRSREVPQAPDSPPVAQPASGEIAQHPIARARPVTATRPAFVPLPILPSAPGQKPAANPFAVVPTDNVVTFDVQGNGLAVAYGDVLLGKVEEGWHGTRGRFDTPLPQLWERPEIPYSIAPDLVNPARVEQALAYYRDHTPIRFVPYAGQPDAVVFETGEENCLSSLGRVGGLQSILLSPKCGTPEIEHEIMHALGFVHEQSRPDRDRYVQIQWDNIEEKYQDQFAMVSEAFTEAMRGSTFDYHSVMIYRPDTFAVSPGAPTMRPTGAEPIAPVTDGLSPEDVRRLNQLYPQ